MRGSKISNNSYGRPYNISERHCDVQLPANINDEDLTAEGPVNIKPFTEVTHYTFALCTIRMTSVMAEIIDRAFSCVTPSRLLSIAKTKMTCS